MALTVSFDRLTESDLIHKARPGTRSGGLCAEAIWLQSNKMNTNMILLDFLKILQAIFCPDFGCDLEINKLYGTQTHKLLIFLKLMWVNKLAYPFAMVGFC